MSKSTQPSHAISGVFVFLLLGIFAVFSTVMVMMGAKASPPLTFAACFAPTTSRASSLWKK